jgi:O-antigen/teichoic acid export membrane protein
MRFPLKSTLARNTGWAFLGQALGLGIQMLYFVVIAHTLGASNYGAFIGTVALVGIASPFATLGSGELLVKYVSRDRTGFATNLGTALATTAVSSSVLFLAVVLLSHFVLPSTIPSRLMLLVAGSDLFGLSVIGICGKAFQAFERLDWTARINTLSSASRLTGALALVAIRHHPSALQWGYLYFFSTVFVAAAALMIVNVRLGPPEFVSLRSINNIREGFYFSTSLSAQTIYNNIDKTMLARLSTLGATGIYGAAYRLIDAGFVPVSSLLAAAYPRFFRVGADGIYASLRFAKSLLPGALLYSVAAGTGLFLFAGVVPHVLGAEYSRTVEALRWLSLLPVLKTLHYLLSDVLTGAGYQGVRTGIQAGVALFNVLVNLWIIPAYSWRGAAWSSIASDGLLACGIGTAVLILSRRSRPINDQIYAPATEAREA